MTLDQIRDDIVAACREAQARGFTVLGVPRTRARC